MASQPLTHAPAGAAGACAAPGVPRDSPPCEGPVWGAARGRDGGELSRWGVSLHWLGSMTGGGSSGGGVAAPSTAALAAAWVFVVSSSSHEQKAEGWSAWISVPRGLTWVRMKR